MIKLTGTLHGNLYTFMKTHVRRQFIHRMRNVSDKSCTENQNTFYVQ